MDGILQSGNVTPGHLAAWVTDGVLADAGAPGSMYAPYYANGVVVNFNGANTDTPIAIALPTGFTRYQVVGCIISGASHTLVTATAGLFTAPGGTGTAIVTAASAITVSTASDNTLNNAQSLTLNNNTTTTFNGSTLYFRVAAAEGVAASATVTLVVLVLP